jgi:hypothetical protein
MISRRFLYATFAAQLFMSLTGAASSMAAPSPSPSPDPPLFGQSRPVPTAFTRGFTCRVNAGLTPCEVVTMLAGENLSIQLYDHATVESALFCAPRRRGHRGGALICATVGKADGMKLLGHNGYDHTVNVQVSVGAIGGHVGTAEGQWTVG